MFEIKTSENWILKTALAARRGKLFERVFFVA
jgi:hypothetical protein